MSRAHGGLFGLLRWTSLRLRLIAVFALVALTAAVSVSGIAYWLNRDAVLTRAQNSALNDFRDSLQRNASSLPVEPTCKSLGIAANRIGGPDTYQVVLIDNSAGGPCAERSDGSTFSMDDVPASLVRAVNTKHTKDDGRYHLHWERISLEGHPYLVAGARINGDGPTGYMLKSLDAERKDLNSLAWSLGIATLLALIGAALLAQAAGSAVLRPVRRLGEAAKRLGEGQLDTRLKVSGTDELAEMSRTFNNAAEQLEGRVEELRAREAASRRFVADMSHELRTPLTAITAVTDVLEDEADALDPMIAPAVRLVVSETRRLNELVETLMEVTRFDAGTAKLRVDEVDVADMIMACMDARAWLDSVELDAPRGLLATIDPRRLDVIMANLIGNALKHGGSPVRVSLRREGGPDGEIVIVVSDRGPGIPEDVLPHVFDRFYKADASRARSEGSGLGLSIAMENAHIHGGDITAANGSEGGAVFTLRMPVRPPAEDDEGGATRANGTAGTNGDDGKGSPPPGGSTRSGEGGAEGPAGGA
ncbi:two-component system, OmpR family, sensor histidine kinase MtrB [Actinacidiphila yanglinensis]|uniref:histidine kinase n=1 Tax=Actinacidiphila yanglinensis TaxID=310779 RepID=A0A1H6BLL7_9ACTN|nr:HAMP domain-containing sensor histidine kinase [Actinacidiphila yanglinensis]SEG61619.1 two-component system, OmpR family, sensor histidine kinase MtrB [Actinacidiphila yanglinensis]